MKNTTKKLQDIAEIAGNRRLPGKNCRKVNKTLQVRFMRFFDVAILGWAGEGLIFCKKFWIYNNLNPERSIES